MLPAAPFSAAFWICYLCGGLSDLLDGAVARKLKTQSDAGAKLDSIADLGFGFALAIAAIHSDQFPVWLWLNVLCSAGLRTISYGIGFWKFHTFAALHTYANKAAGGIVFAFPVLSVLLGFNVTAGLLCAAAFFSSLEELVITMKSGELDRDCRGLF